MSQKVFQIKLLEVMLNENGTMKENEKGDNALEATLFYPKEGIPSLKSVRTMHLKDNQPLDYSQKPLDEQILFKQSIHGDTILEFNLTSRVKVAKLARTIIELIGVAAKAAIGTIPGLGSVVTAVAQGATGSLFKISKEKVNILGTGRITLNENHLTENEQSKQIDLKVPDQTKIYQMIMPMNGDPYQDKKILKKGDGNGYVKFKIEHLT